MRVSVGSVADSIFDMNDSITNMKFDNNDSITNMKFHVGDCNNTKTFYEYIPENDYNDPEGFKSAEEAMAYEEEYRRRLMENGDILIRKINEALKTLW